MSTFFSSRPSWQLSRRTVLRGAGALIALPLLEAMAPRRARAQSTSPTRFFAFYVPCGMHMAAFTPSTLGALPTPGDLPPILAPLAGVIDDVNVISGLQNRAAFADGDGAGDHARGTGTFLTCTRLRKSDVEIENAISLDQVLADHLRRDGYDGLPSIELGCEGGGSTGNCDSGYSCAYSVNIAWSGPQSPLPKETDPRQAFDRLFGPGDSAQTAAEAEKRRRHKRSVLDVVRQDAARLQAKLGRADQAKLDEYLTGVRELERRIDDASRQSCGAQTRPEPFSGDTTSYVRAMLDLVVAGFACDRMRVATFMLGNGGSGRDYSFLGANTAHHEASHHQNDPVRLQQLQTIDTWEVEQLAYVIGRLRAFNEGEGTLLHHSTVFFSSEIEDGNSHYHGNLPVIVAGRAGGLITPGRHLSFPEVSTANLFSTVLQSFGAPTAFADSTGPLVLT
jgi:hypothetical protein